MGFDAFVTAGVLIVYAFSTVVLLNKAPSAYEVRLFIYHSLCTAVVITAIVMMADTLWMLPCMATLLQIGYVVGSSLLVLGLTFQGALYWVRCLWGLVRYNAIPCVH